MKIWLALNGFSRSAARRPARCLLAACGAGVIAATSVASPIDLDVGGASHFAVLSINSRTPGSEAARDASNKTPLAQAKNDALRAAAASLERNGITSSARATTVPGSSGVNAPVLKQGSRIGNADTLILSRHNRGESPVFEVLRGWSMNSTNIDVAASAASSGVLFNILENGGVSWDEVLSNATRAPPKKLPPGALAP